jgi:hypothetical protein
MHQISYNDLLATPYQISLFRLVDELFEYVMTISICPFVFVCLLGGFNLCSATDIIMRYCVIQLLTFCTIHD